MPHYALAQLVGAGTDEDPFRPPTDQPFTMIDMRPVVSVPQGYAVVATAEADMGIGEYLGDSVDVVSAAQLRAARRVFGVNLPSGITFAEALGTLLTSEARTDGTRWKPLNPQRRRTPQGGLVDRREIWLGDRKIWQSEAPVLAGGARLFEDFNKSNSSTLGPDQTWFEASGQWEVKSQNAVVTTQGTSVAFINSPLQTDSQYAEVEVETGSRSASNFCAVVLRAAGATTNPNRYAFEIGRDDDGQIVRTFGGTATVLGTWTMSPHVWELLAAGRAIGSTLELFRNRVLIGVVTDTQIPTGKYVGMHISGTTLADAQTSTLDNFLAEDVTNDIAPSGSVRPAGDLVKVPQKPVGGTITLSSELTTRKVVTKTFSGVVAPSGAMERAFTGAVTGTIAPSGELVKSMGRVFEAEAAPSAMLEFSPVKTLAGTLAPSGSLSTTLLGALAGRPGLVAASWRRAGEIRARARKG